ncbi:tyrosine recombinase XerC [Lentzea sp. NBRC 105346]|uniref:tyrosine-type recombinase/integrase n=1 Tax=Lentzea sp. NBRC 105346 TaxID=3032205 RepID=UPI0024A18AC4|nr:tyrosine-type recombinase/integrase [Lentzea sp. NBRC 105346]GLZ34909.1 tyrosine recombinase XerC [Lentzea sp. NBRC 105346]
MAENPALAEWNDLKREWLRALKADNKSDNTIEVYERAVRQLVDWLNDNSARLADDGHDELGPCDIEAGALREFQADMLERTSPGNTHTWHRSVCTFFNWLVAEEERSRSPMDKVKPPIVPKKSIPLVADDVTKAVLDQCKGNDLISRRDTAIIRLLFDTGCRLSEIANLKKEDVDLDLDVIHVLGKGRKPRSVPFSPKTGQAISRYLRVRNRAKTAHLPWLWLGDRSRGHLQANGIKIMLRRRGERLGMNGKGNNLHAHRWRHTAAVAWRKNGGDTTSMKRIFGWKSDAMVGHYGDAAADEVAHQHARELNLGDRL